VRKEREVDKCVKNLSASFLFPIFGLNFAYSQLAAARRNVGLSAKEESKKVGVVAVQKFQPIPRFGDFCSNEHIKKLMY